MTIRIVGQVNMTFDINYDIDVVEIQQCLKILSTNFV